MSAAKTTFNVGIIGYGLSAKVFHIPFIALTPTLKLHSILQRTPTPSSSAPADHPALAHHTSLPEFLADPSLDVVVLSTPPQTHHRFALAALDAGKHVLVEKPFVPTSAEARELASHAASRGLVLAVYQNRRWDSDFLTLRSLLDSGKLGRVLEYNTYFERYRPAAPGGGWKAETPVSEGGGVLHDLGTHLIDQAYALWGLPDSVRARLTRQRDEPAATSMGDATSGKEGSSSSFEPDSMVVELWYKSLGTAVRASATVHSAEARQPRFWVRGTKGSYRKCGLDAQEAQLKAGMSTDDKEFALEGPEWDGVLTTVGEGGELKEEKCPNLKPVTYAKFYELFAKSLASGKEEDVPVKATEAADVLRILEAAMESAREGRDVVLK